MIKVKILILGPYKSGKSRLCNYLVEIRDKFVPSELRPTNGVRIVELEISNLNLKNGSGSVEVQLWDCSGDERYMSCWPSLKKGVNGVMFVYSSKDLANVHKLDTFYDYFVNQQGLTHRQCIVFCNQSDEDMDKPLAKLSPNFSRMSHTSVNLSAADEKFRNDFNQFITTIVNNM